MDEFYDVVFNIDNKSYIKGNSAVLKARSEFFNSMFKKSHDFKESNEKCYIISE